ncbi:MULTISPECIES: hypothetical protein [unclassified Pseudomonas]|uniref:hypothetical protein n=1 Tax=unclassified Pseudomonas TaxID=196821 RepID=UPI0021141942|nr:MULTISPECIES: hypothetical protein [unclassified Pseudomonas]
MSIEAKLLNLQAIHNLFAPYRYLYCVDLESTCDQVDESESPKPLAAVPDQMETIEIGLVVVDLETLEMVDEFQRSSDLKSILSSPISASNSYPFNKRTWIAQESMWRLVRS